MPFRRARRRSIASLLVFSSVLLSACTNASIGSTFSAAGTATHEVRVAVDRASIASDQADAVNEVLVLVETRARAAGLDIRRISSNVEVGLLVSSSTDDATDAGAALNTLINSLSPADTSAPVAPFIGTFGQDSPALGGNEYQLSLAVDGLLLQDAFDAFAKDLLPDTLPDGTAVEFDVTYQATMPGEIKETNGESIDSNTARWVLPLDAVTQVNAVSSVGQNTPWLSVVGTTLGIGGLIGLVALLVFRVLVRRHAASVAIGSGSPESRPRNTLHPRPAIKDALAAAVTRALRGGGAIDRDLTQTGRVIATGPKGEEVEEPDGTHAQRD